MTIIFTAAELLRMAIQVEECGIRFYQSAAEKSRIERSRRLLLDLAERENEHRATFSDMLERLTPPEKDSHTHDPDNQSSLYLSALADERVCPHTDPALLLGSEPSAELILKTALALEKESIVFYVGLRDMVPERQGRNRVDDILREEMRHVTILRQELARA
jgi:rubrerythrin